MLFCVTQGSSILLLMFVSDISDVWVLFVVDQAEHPPPLKIDLISRVDQPPVTFSQSTNLPYPMVMFANKFQTDVDKSPNIHTSASIAKDELSDTVDDNDRCLEFHQKYHCYQSSNSNKPHIFTSVKLKCENQGKSFTRNECLTRHNQMHIDERPYKCNTFGKSFTKNDHLTSHTRIHTEQRPYICKVCGKAFHQRFNLKTHNRIHTGERPYECNICGKSFTQKGNLRTHNRIHIGERPYECEVCGKAFHQSGGLRRHNLTHSGERPYDCNICGESFTRNDYLTSHNQTHSEQKS